MSCSFAPGIAKDKICDNDFCFKCHRQEQGNQGEVYTVNSIAFNKEYNTFCTVGSDGNYICWNKDTKARYKSSKTAAALPMTSCAFTPDASLLAFASGEDWSKGLEFSKSRQNLVKLWVRRTDNEDVIKPKK